MIDPDRLLALDSPEVTHSYDARDTMLHALGCGYGIDPLDTGQLAFVTEPGLRVAPTMAVVLPTRACGIASLQQASTWCVSSTPQSGSSC